MPQRLPETPPVEPLFHYIILRRDMPLGNVLAQLTHAAGESSPGNLPANTHAVVLSVDSEQELLALEPRLQAQRLSYVLIREPDPPFNNGATAIGLTPVVKSSATKRALGGLRLFKELL